MKTLLININGKAIQSDDNIKVIGLSEDSIVDSFYISLGMAIADGVTGIKYKPLVAEFAKAKPEEFESFTKQWNEVKALLLGENPSGDYEFVLSSEYLEWLKMNGTYFTIYNKKYQGQREAVIKLSLDELYEDTLYLIGRRTIHFLEKEDNYKNFEAFVVNDEAVTRRSQLVRSIKNKFEDLAFILYEKWLDERNICPKCEKSSCECGKEVCPICGKNPCVCKNKEQSSFLLLAIDRDGSHDIFDIKGVSIYDKSLLEIYSKKSDYIEMRWGAIKAGDPLRLFIGERYGLSGSYDLIGFDGKTSELKNDECPWNKPRPYHSFSEEAFLKKHPEYDGCEQPYHEIEKDVYIIQAYKKDSFTVDVWNSIDEFLCTLAPKTAIDRVLPSGLYVILQWIDEDYLAYGIADRYGKILLPCKYKKRHKMNPNMGREFDEKAPGVVYCDEFSTESNNYCYYKNLFNGDFYCDVTRDFYVKKYYDKYERQYITLIDKENRRELYHLQSSGITERQNGWYEVFIEGLDEERRYYEENSHLTLVSKKALIELSFGEALYDGYAEHAFENLQNISERYFISESHIITMTETSEASGLGVFKEIKIYNSQGEKIKEYEFSKLPLLIKSPYKYGKALCLKVQGGDISIWYLDVEGKEHLIPHKGGFKVDDYSRTELFMISDNAFVINKKGGDYCGELRSIEGDVLFRKASWILPFADKFLAYYSKSGGKYGIIDSKGNKIIPPKFDEYELFEYTGEKYIHYRQYGDYKELE